MGGYENKMLRIQFSKQIVAHLSKTKTWKDFFVMHVYVSDAEMESKSEKEHEEQQKQDQSA